VLAVGEVPVLAVVPDDGAGAEPEVLPEAEPLVGEVEPDVPVVEPDVLVVEPDVPPLVVVPVPLVPVEPVLGVPVVDEVPEPEVAVVVEPSVESVGVDVEVEELGTGTPTSEATDETASCTGAGRDPVAAAATPPAERTPAAVSAVSFAVAILAITMLLRRLR